MNIAICQHMLPSNSVIETLRQHSPNAYVVGKRYSTIGPQPASGKIPDFVDLSVDEGNVLADMGIIPLAAVEQTTGGVRCKYRWPCVWVARSAAKLQIESQVIAEGILAKLRSLLPAERSIGIIGGGALGTALEELLKNQKSWVGTYERKRPDSMPLRELIAKSNVLLGCVGKSIVMLEDLISSGGEKIFVSCSSANREFATLLAYAGASSEFGTFVGSAGKTRYHVLNGGYPINFDRQREWEDPHGIWLTRKLVLSAVEQAISLFGKRPGGYMLDPNRQLEDIELWINQLPDPSRYKIPKFSYSEIIQLSEGICEMAEKPYDVHETTPTAVARMRQHKDPYEVTVRGINLIVLPGVWSPAYDWSSDFNVEFLPPVAGLDVLEIGPGTGVISTHVGLRGARSIVAADVNPMAVENTRLNFERHKIKQGTAIISEGFDNVTGKFDVILFPAPYHGNKPADLLERGCSDEGYQGIKAFFRDVKNHLNPGGVVQFGAAESGDLELLRGLFYDSGFRVRRELSDWRQGYNCMLFDLDINELEE